MVEVIVVTDKPNTNITKQYRFTIFESQTRSLFKHKEGFVRGNGVYWNSHDNVRVWIDIEEKNN